MLGCEPELVSSITEKINPYTDSYDVRITQSGVYLITLEFKSLDNFWLTNFEEAVRPKWKDLFPGHLQRLLNERLSTEARAKAAGVSIDENYLPPRMERVN